MKASNPNGFMIKHNVPMPMNEKYNKYPLGDLKVGDSFFIPNKKPADIGGSLSYYKLKHGVRFASRQVTEQGVPGIRVWRVE